MLEDDGINNMKRRRCRDMKIIKELYQFSDDVRQLELSLENLRLDFTLYGAYFTAFFFNLINVIPFFILQVIRNIFLIFA